MRPSNIFVFCLLAATFYFLSPSISSSTPLTLNPGRRPSRKLTMPSSNHHGQSKTIKVNEEKRKLVNLEGSMAIKRVSKEEEEEQLYHIDYHGVTTHPTPIPKHP